MCVRNCSLLLRWYRAGRDFADEFSFNSKVKNKYKPDTGYFITVVPEILSAYIFYLCKQICKFVSYQIQIILFMLYAHAVLPPVFQMIRDLVLSLSFLPGCAASQHISHCRPLDCTSPDIHTVKRNFPLMVIMLIYTVVVFHF